MDENKNIITDNINYLEFSNTTFYIIIVLLICIILLILYNNYYCSKLKSVKIQGGNILNSLDKKISITEHPKKIEFGNTSPIFEKKYDLITEIENFHEKQDKFIESL